MPENKNQNPSPPENLPTAEEPLKEFLKREEIKTMEKDVAKLREVEAKQEREKISTIKAEGKPVQPVQDKPAQSKPFQQFSNRSFEKFPEQPPAPLPEKTPAPEKTPLDSLMPKAPPRKRSAFRKIFIRGALIIFLASILGGFLYFFLKNKPEEVIIPSNNQGGATTTPNAGSSLPQSLIATDQTKIIEISKGEDPSLILNQVLADATAEASLTRILVKNTDENRFLSAKEVIPAAFKFPLPDEILSKLEGDYTLAIFGQKEGNRLTFSAKTKDKPGLIEALKKWEKETSAASPFKTAASQGTLFRYLTLGKNDLGVCYLVLDDYFVLTNSFQGMAKIIQELNFEKKLGQLLMVGFEGKTLTPELETFIKKYKPGALLLLSKNVESKEQIKTLTSQLQALSLKETGLPLLIAADQEGGPITRVDFLGEKTPQKEIGDNGKAFQVGETRGKELKDLGINLNLAPVLDWATAGDFLFDRSFQKPAEATGDLAKSLILGQKSGGILTSIKHFPGYSGITFNPENKLAELEAIPEISQFKKAMEANPEFVMTSNVVYKDINSSLPFSFSPQAIQLLKGSLGESVLILSDDLAQDSLIKKFSLEEVMARPVEAGIDMLIFSGYKVPVEQGLDEFIKAYKNGEISKGKVEKAILRITQLKNNLLK
ncbi:MAG: glycoside hydrolase family 3 N-terminal domain-containing protein [bacterium]|nr:glycoside hydrolase family 3 N-terminal domain-containing protein [bacterium]